MTTKKYFIIAGIILLLLCLKQKGLAQIKTLKGSNLPGTEIDAFILKQMDSLKIPAISIAIIQNGRVMYYKATGVKNEKHEAIDTNTVFEAASMTKPVFAYAVHKLVQKGVLNLDTPLYRYYPYDDIDHDERYKRITARMVLSHTSGFPNWRGCGGSELTIIFEPGTRYGYSGEGYDYLAIVIKHLLHKTTDDMIAEEVFRPMLIKNSSLVRNQYIQSHITDALQDDGLWGWSNAWQRPNVAFSLCTEAREYAKFVMQLMKEKHANESVFQQMSAGQIEAEPGKWACLGLFMEQTPYGYKYGHSGNNGNRYNSNFEFYRDHDLGYVFLINCHKEPELTKRLNEFLETGKQ